MQKKFKSIMVLMAIGSSLQAMQQALEQESKQNHALGIEMRTQTELSRTAAQRINRNVSKVLPRESGYLELTDTSKKALQSNDDVTVVNEAVRQVPGTQLFEQVTIKTSNARRVNKAGGARDLTETINSLRMQRSSNYRWMLKLLGIGTATAFTCYGIDKISEKRLSLRNRALAGLLTQGIGGTFLLSCTWAFAKTGYRCFELGHTISEEERKKFELEQQSNATPYKRKVQIKIIDTGLRNNKRRNSF